MPRYITYGLYICGLCLLLTLGAWQLSRGLHKHDVKQAWDARQGNLVELQVLKTLPEINKGNYQSVSLAGRWLIEQQFLLDNRVFKGQVGFEVLSPFRLSGDGQLILVNRGWIAKTEAKQPQLSAQMSNSDTVISGDLYLPDPGFTLGEAYIDMVNWPRIVQFIDQVALGRALNIDLASAVMVLNVEEASAYERIWQPSVVSPARHYAYAVQWWGLALVMVIFGLIWRKQALATRTNMNSEKT